MSIDAIEKKFQENLDRFDGLDPTFLFDFGTEGCLCVDATEFEPTLSRGESDADCVIRITSDNLLKLIEGNLNAGLALATGKLKVSGDSFAAMKLQAVLAD